MSEVLIVKEQMAQSNRIILTALHGAYQGGI